MLQLAYNEKGENKKRYIEPKSLLGKSFGVHLKKGGSFYFKCTGSELKQGTYHNEYHGFSVVTYSELFLNGYDEEGLDIQIKLDDIELITGV